MPLTLLPTRNIIDALAGQTVFNYTFADAGITISPIIVSTLTLTGVFYVERTIATDYTLDRSAKTVTFLIAPATTFGAGVKVKIERATKRSRNIQHDPASTVTSTILNRDEEQSFRYKQELEDKSLRTLDLDDREEHFSAEDKKILLLTDAVDPQDAMNRRTTAALISASGNVPLPGAGKTGFVLTEESPTTFNFRNRGVPIPATADLDSVLVSDGSGEGNYRWAKRGVNIPATADAESVLVADGSGEGNHRWAKRGVPIPATADLDKMLRVTGSGEGAVAFGLKLPEPTAGEAGEVATATGAGEAEWAPSFAPNLAFNSDFSVAQRGLIFTSATTPLNNDDTWLLDRWLLLSRDTVDGVDVSQELTIIPDGAFASIKLEAESANSKFGIAQIFEARDTKRIRRDGDSTVVSLSFEARTTSGLIRNLRASVWAWDGTADAVTSDLVDGTNWGAEGADPTPATDWTSEKAGTDLVLTNAFQRFTVEGIALDTAGTTNLAIFIWVDDADMAISDVVYISKVKLQRGVRATLYEAPGTFAEELDKARRYCQVFEPKLTQAPFCTGQGALTTTGHFALVLPVRMRVNPTATFTAAGTFRVRTGGNNNIMTSGPTSIIEGVDAIRFTFTTANPWTAGDALVLEDAAGAARIRVEAEL